MISRKSWLRPRNRRKGSSDKTSNDKLHLELLGEIIPKFLAEAARRGGDTTERKSALRAILEAH